MVGVFRDRAEAGRRLAAELAPYASDRPIVVALPRGGVVTGRALADALDAPLDVLVVRKLGALYQPEFGVGAIAPGGVQIVDRRWMRLVGMDESDMARVIASETRELARREGLYRRGRAPLEVKGRTVILVDDGIATGVTVRAAILALRRLGAARIIVATGVCAAETADRLRPVVDDLVSLVVAEDMIAVGLYYQDFPQVDDETVIELLTTRAPLAAAAPGRVRRPTTLA